MLASIVQMFGMTDPSQTLHQLERYVEDGRMEMSEVMASQFTEMFLAQKNRSADQQTMLVKGLRILTDVLLARGKAPRAAASIKMLHKERKKLVAMFQSGAPHLLEKMTPASEDFRRAGNIYATLNKRRAARKSYSKCEKLAPGHVANALDACTLLGLEKSTVTRLISTAQSAGPVISANGVFELQPENRPAVNLNGVIEILQKAAKEGILASQCSELAESYQHDIGRIQRGEAAANARLQSALDSLETKHDYYQY